METPQTYNFLNLRKPVSHLTFFAFSLVVTLIIGFSGRYGSWRSSFGIFFILFAQLEVFIFFGNKLFADLNFDKSPGEITRTVLLRFMVFLLICLFVSMILYLIVKYSDTWIVGGSLANVLNEFLQNDIHDWFKSTISGLTFGAVIFVVLLWQASLKREQKLREEKLIFQNETLKTQVNPHFLFNSLNTLSSLVATQPEVAEEFITRLSAIYRYILEYSSIDHVPLSVELEFIKDYFFLHKIRDERKIKLDIDVHDIDDYAILPVSLQILVENAIKHNKATRESPLTISIYIENKYVVVKNNLQLMAVQLNSTKIGLRNLGERVNLITRKKLVIEESANEFIVKIPLL
jgi:two-component system LytT family sensor kinase